MDIPSPFPPTREEYQALLQELTQLRAEKKETALSVSSPQPKAAEDLEQRLQFHLHELELLLMPSELSI
jgi:DNA repair ATPase RecN